MTEPNLASCVRASRMRMAPVVMELAAEIRRAFIGGCFDACTNGASFHTARVKEDEQHVFLPEIIPQRLLGALVRNGDCRCFDMVRRNRFGMMAAEALGTTISNFGNCKNSTNPAVQRLLARPGGEDHPPGHNSGEGRERNITLQACRAASTASGP